MISLVNRGFARIVKCDEKRDVADRDTGKRKEAAFQTLAHRNACYCILIYALSAC